MSKTGPRTDPLPLRLDGIADRIAAIPVQGDDAAAIREAALKLRAIERVATRPVLVCPGCGGIKGEDPNCGWMGEYKRVRVPVVPVPDDQAIERAAEALGDQCHERGFFRDEYGDPFTPMGQEARDMARAVLAAALEQPDPELPKAQHGQEDTSAPIPPEAQ